MSDEVERLARVLREGLEAYREAVRYEITSQPQVEWVADFMRIRGVTLSAPVAPRPTPSDRGRRD